MSDRKFKEIEANEEDIITVLRWQMENSEVIRQKDETLKWHKQLDINFD